MGRVWSESREVKGTSTSDGVSGPMGGRGVCRRAFMVGREHVDRLEHAAAGPTGSGVLYPQGKRGHQRFPLTSPRQPGYFPSPEGQLQSAVLLANIHPRLSGAPLK